MLVELLNKSFADQYEKRGLLTAAHTADYLLANGVTVSNWRDAKTDPPKESGEYLVVIQCPVGKYRCRLTPYNAACRKSS